MSLIDTSYFFGDCSIGQLSEQSVQGKLNWLINQYEPEILLGLLGYETYTAFTAGLKVIPIDPMWTDLRDGKEYTDVNGVVRKWRGLIYTTGTYKGSLIANYVYYQYQKTNVTNTGGTGEGVMQSENAISATPIDKMVKAWNNMVYINRELFDFLYNNKDTYSDWLNSVFRISGMYGAYHRNNANKFLQTINAFT
jgi:hypothetical protein